MKRLLTLLVIVISSMTMSASHLLGGEIWWDCQSNGKYVFYLRLYRDCTGIQLGTGPQSLTTNAPGGSITCTIVSGYPKDVSPSGPNCSGSLDINCANPTTGAVQEFLWKSGPVTLNGVPPAAGWTFSWSSCARPFMNNLTGGCYYLRALMFPFNDGTGNRNANPCFDNSPEFLEAPKVTTCAGYPFAFNNFAFDSELDSLYFDWAQPLTAAGTSVTFVAPYSYTNPVPGIQSFAQDAGQVNINTTLTGKFATCMKVTAYKYGQKVAEIYRDIPIILLSCPGSTNDPPTLDVINDPLPAPQLTPILVGNDTLFYEMTVNAGEYVHFKMQSFDDDFHPNFSPQQIEFVGVGGNLGSPAGSTTNCLFNPPCATITPISPQSTFSSALTNNVEFSWQTACNHLSFNPYAGGSARSQYLFYFKMQDDFCPAPSFKLITARINVVSPAPIAPDLTNSCLSYDLINNTTTLDFIGPAYQDTAQNFDYYVVYRGDGINFAGYDTIYDWSESQYIDAAPDTANPFYYMRTYGGCTQESLSSDTVSLIIPSMVAYPPVNSYVAQLSWNSPRTGSGATNTYEIWRQVAGSGNWQQVGSTGTTSYSDTVNLCSAVIDYQIRISGGCESYTVQDTFSDQINADSLAIAYVTVQNGKSVVEFPATKADDVVGYYILKWVNGAWVQEDSIGVGTASPYSIPSSDPTSGSERYLVLSVDSCGNVADTLKVGGHNTIFLDGDLDPCEGEMTLRWVGYHGWEGGVDSYSILADITPSGGTTQIGVLLGTQTGNDTTFLQDNLISGAAYCYYIQATDTSGNITSVSNQYCIASDVVIQSQLQYLARTTVQIDGSVELWAFIDGQADVDEYEIQRAEEELGPWVTLGVIPQPTFAPYEIRFTDYSANTSSQRYYYRVRSDNACGGVDTISNYGTNIFLEVSANDNLTNQLTWNDYRDYDGDVDHYVVYRKQKNAANWVMVADNVVDPAYTDNIRSFGQGEGQFCYRVAAVEGANSLGFTDENGGPMTSYSNEACVDQESRGFFPNAFSPNSAIAENQVWKPMTTFEDESDFSVSIINRQGAEVYQSNSPDEGWDGTFRGQEQPEGVYFYIVKFRSKEGKLKEERGSITLIR